jgi:hypothetical protein
MLGRPQCHSTAGRIRSMKNSDDPIGNRTRDLPGEYLAQRKSKQHALRKNDVLKSLIILIVQNMLLKTGTVRISSQIMFWKFSGINIRTSWHYWRHWVREEKEQTQDDGLVLATLGEEGSPVRHLQLRTYICSSTAPRVRCTAQITQKRLSKSCCTNRPSIHVTSLGWEAKRV